VGIVLITTPIIATGYQVMTTPPPQDQMKRLGWNLGIMMAAQVGMIIYHNNSTNENRVYVLPNSPMGQWVEKVVQQEETYARTQLPPQLGDKVVHWVEVWKTNTYSPIEHVYTTGVTIPKGLPRPPVLPSPPIGTGGEIIVTKRPIVVKDNLNGLLLSSIKDNLNGLLLSSMSLGM
jgi:hypothetical protein